MASQHESDRQRREDRERDERGSLDRKKPKRAEEKRSGKETKEETKTLSSSAFGDISFRRRNRQTEVALRGTRAGEL
jgi:hypothetical protein